MRRLLRDQADCKLQEFLFSSLFRVQPLLSLRPLLHQTLRCGGLSLGSDFEITSPVPTVPYVLEKDTLDSSRQLICERYHFEYPDQKNKMGNKCVKNMMSGT